MHTYVPAHPIRTRTQRIAIIQQSDDDDEDDYEEEQDESGAERGVLLSLRLRLSVDVLASLSGDAAARVRASTAAASAATAVAASPASAPHANLVWLRLLPAALLYDSVFTDVLSTVEASQLRFRQFFPACVEQRRERDI